MSGSSGFAIEFTLRSAGRVYKGRWDSTRRAGESLEARGQLRKAIAAYVAGFEADLRDAYPGVNAATLMEMPEQPDPRQQQLLPLVRYAAKRRTATGGDYWDHATLLELAVIARDGEPQDSADIMPQRPCHPTADATR